jgi:hypothetical protein
MSNLLQMPAPKVPILSPSDVVLLWAESPAPTPAGSSSSDSGAMIRCATPGCEVVDLPQHLEACDFCGARFCAECLVVIGDGLACSSCRRGHAA